MSIVVYLALTGARQGVIKGDVTAKGREGTIAVTAIAHEITTPIDEPTGAVTGRRQHKPITITMLIDQATPKLYQALVTNEVLTAARMTFWRPSADGSGTEALYFTIALTNALIVDVALKRLDNHDPATLKRFEEYMEVQFSYQKIEWTWTDGGVTATDDWQN